MTTYATFQRPNFTLLTACSPSPTTITIEDYLNEVYGRNGRIRVSNIGRTEIEYVRRYGTKIPVDVGIRSLWPFPLRGDLVLTPDFYIKLAVNIADWSYCVASFDTDQDLSRLLQAVAEKKFPVIAVTALGDSGVQLLLRTNASSEATWTAAYEGLRAEFAELGAIAPGPMYEEVVALPGHYPGCEFVYVDFEAAKPRG